MSIVKYIISIAILLIITTLTTIEITKITNIITPFNQVRSQESEIRKLEKAFSISYSISKQIWEVAVSEGLDPFFLAALIFTESSFRPEVQSTAGYHGLAQIPWRIPYTDVNILIGARIFKEKLRVTDGDVRKALVLYKGYDLRSKRGWDQADKVLRTMEEKKLEVR